MMLVDDSYIIERENYMMIVHLALIAAPLNSELCKFRRQVSAPRLTAQTVSTYRLLVYSS